MLALGGDCVAQETLFRKELIVDSIAFLITNSQTNFNKSALKNKKEQTYKITFLACLLFCFNKFYTENIGFLYVFFMLVNIFNAYMV